MKINAPLPYFGANRLLAANVGKAMAGCKWVGVPFVGGMSELAYIKASTVVANDLHRGVINFARTVAHPYYGVRLLRRLSRLPFHPDLLRAAQERCLARGPFEFAPSGLPDFEYAEDFFVCAWMGRSGKTGTKGEFEGNLSVRWNANGGDSAVRYASAAASLREWRQIIARVNWLCMDAFEFLAECRHRDQPGHGIYCDPPFPGAGEEYRHSLTTEQHRELARVLTGFEQARVVCRFYDHPLIREVYHPAEWEWFEFTGRKQSNDDDAPEVLLVSRHASDGLFR